MHDLSTTVVAIATPAGRGGIGCVRISGPQAHAVAAELFRSNSGRELPRDGAPRFGTFVDAGGEGLDHGYLVAFPPERAYTGEPAVELWAHGSPPVLQALMAAAIAKGAVAAGPGEFTYRALRHGRLDLSRAEAVRDLIAARTVHQARVAFRQVEGSLARRLAPVREMLIDLVAVTEAAIEFADEAEAHMAAGALAAGIEKAREEAQKLLAGAQDGRIVREGARVALSGVTSVGKSSLFNRLLGQDRAIVSAVPGTTRDTLEETIDIEGIAVTLVDTAGLRPADDAIEAEGVRRARIAAGEADLVLLLIDASRPIRSDEREALAHGDVARRIVVATKSDRAAGSRPEPGALAVSSVTGSGIDALRRAIALALGGARTEDPAVTNIRHIAALEEMSAALDRAAAALPLGEEIVLEEMRAALAAVGEIGGDLASDDLYDRIFSTFCIGK